MENLVNSQIHFFKVSKTESSKTLDLCVRESLHSTSGQRPKDRTNPKYFSDCQINRTITWNPEKKQRGN